MNLFHLSKSFINRGKIPNIHNILSRQFIFRNAVEHADRLAIVDHKGSYTYSSILNQSYILSRQIENLLKQRKEDKQKQICMLCPNEITYVIAQWAIWQSGNVAVPLYKDHPASFLEYFVKNSESSLILTTNEYTDKVKSIVGNVDIPYLVMDYPKIQQEEISKDVESHLNQMDLNQKDKGLILYTSGTTGPPKGVVLTHSTLHYQLKAIAKAWEWTKDDVILNALPLHHVHGIVYALLCPFLTGSCCILMPKFSAPKVWEMFIDNAANPRVNMFLGVPTMYTKLIQEYEKSYENNKEMAEQIKSACENHIRLMASGSSSLPQPVIEKWRDITGHTLLDRYGMTELGMAIANPLKGRRLSGTVGKPLPDVQARIAKQNADSPSGYEVIVECNDEKTTVIKNPEPGDLQIKGPNVFSEYFNKPKETQETFTSDGWFKTGDVAEYVDGYFKILGRSSADIIKSGGYKISALDIERHLLAHPLIEECSVVGVPDPVWNEKVAAVIKTKNNSILDVPELKSWCKTLMPSYYVPSVFHFTEFIPRNALGKVNKKELVKAVFPN